eukprot:jgi/Botrbrau1/16558/Bobra.0385s0001.2
MNRRRSSVCPSPYADTSSRLPGPDITPRYKTELCRFHGTIGGCGRGDKCTYAHGERELRSPSERSARHTSTDSSPGSLHATGSGVLYRGSPVQACPSSRRVQTYYLLPRTLCARRCMHSYQAGRHPLPTTGCVLVGMNTYGLPALQKVSRLHDPAHEEDMTCVGDSLCAFIFELVI